MGRSVSYPSGAIVAFTVLEVESDDDWEFEYEWLREDLRERAAKAFPSLIQHDGWRGREDRILMRNAYADFGVSVYGELVAVWIVEREDGAYWDADWRTARSPRAQRWLSQIASRFDAMFGDYDCLGHMSNGEGVYPWRLEQSHAMLIGTTGTGKTVAISDMIAEARAKGQNCVVFDLTGAFIEQFHDARRDIILNPLDARCPQWNLFDECRTEADFWTAADALVPHDGGGEAQFWVLGARALFVKFCVKLVAEGRGSNAALAHELMTADLSEVHEMMRGTIADPLTAPEAARMAESIRAVFNVNAKALEMLPTEGRRFSVREWIEEAAECPAGRGSILFISSRYVDMSVASQMLTLWLDTAMNTLMTTERTRDLKCWFFVDELGALHRLPALEKGLQTARNFGGAIVLGIHAYAKLKEVYGENMAATLASLARTKLILSVAERDTAIWCSDFIGHEEVVDIDEGYTFGYNNARDAVSLNRRTTIKPLRMPDQLMNLKSLHGYIKFPEGFPAAFIKLRPVSRSKVADAFIGRGANRPPPTTKGGVPNAPRPQPGGPPAHAGSDHPSSNDDGAGKSTARKSATGKQGELAFDRGQRGGQQADRRADPQQSLRLDADKAGKTAPTRSRNGRSGPGKEGKALAGKSEETRAAAASKGKGKPQGASNPATKLGRKTSDDAIAQKPPLRGQQSEPRANMNGELKAKADDPKLNDPNTPKGLAQANRQRVSDARKLMIEDGLPERSEPPRASPDFGDLEL